ncbi:hypothetical protein OS493_030821 [Desmophyllum pertusum]|uniref:CCHC-type domain-containing protein n=1 Tax=Desmophyllum pertusum TaxID=174260 RepID=A0A9X0CIL7_9CNID|nr:hypothetical protein OS493_030821 [Desmophyllum pertusum]
MARVAGFDCRVWYRRQPAYCTICQTCGHRGKGCPLNGLRRRCQKPGHVARECRNAWANRSTSVRRPAAPAAPAPAAAPAAADPSAAPMLQLLLLPRTPPAKSETAMAVSDDEESDMDYIPGEDEKAHLTDSPEFASGDKEVVAAAPTTQSPRRPRRRRKRRGQGPPAPTLVLDPESGVMDLSSKEPSDARLLHTFREVWEDTLSLEEIRARKVDYALL